MLLLPKLISMMPAKSLLVSWPRSAATHEVLLFLAWRQPFALILRAIGFVDGDGKQLTSDYAMS